MCTGCCKWENVCMIQSHWMEFVRQFPLWQCHQLLKGPQVPCRNIGETYEYTSVHIIQNRVYEQFVNLDKQHVKVIKTFLFLTLIKNNHNKYIPYPWKVHSQFYNKQLYNMQKEVLYYKSDTIKIPQLVSHTYARCTVTSLCESSVVIVGARRTWILGGRLGAVGAEVTCTID